MRVRLRSSGSRSSSDRFIGLLVSNWKGFLTLLLLLVLVTWRWNSRPIVEEDVPLRPEHVVGDDVKVEMDVEVTPRNGYQLYFAFGSDMLEERVKRGSSKRARKVGVARIDEMQFTYSIFSKVWRGAVANLVPNAGSEAWGVVYQFPEVDIPALDAQKGIDKDDPKYEKIEVNFDGAIRGKAFTYVVRPEKRGLSTTMRGSHPSVQYRNCILKGAEEANLPKNYIDFIVSLEDNGIQFKRRSVGDSCDRR